MSEKIVFFDIDGTLLNEKKELCEMTIQSIKQLQINGIHVAIATGRPPFMFKTLRKKLKIDTYISYTGSYVVCNGELIYQNTMDENKVKQLYDDAIKKSFPIVLMGESNMQVTVDNHPNVNDIMERLQFGYPNVNPSFPNESIYQILLFHELSDTYIKSFPEFHFLKWSPIATDVLPVTSSKKRGVKAIIDRLNIDLNHTYAFGDGLNDLDMIDYVGTGVAMDNAVNEVKEVADYITSSVDDKGIKKGLQMLELI